ncbi:starvation-inducible transcriptional regulator [Enterobacteria phage RB68]|jgi:hypothetical protein|uniref:Uncharacterized 14.6 kDa protein in mobD-ri intergenic region n=91 Tax=root TaxID=1 RepID=Y05O_BPT4|nr:MULTISPECIES: DUF5856 family protein [Enterobacteriaceae]NP_049716.1 starvation-inducible transcriptional regulator [Escherichia phage T4]YP_002854064.1 starvation-inducible transcriptional regulator [Enterobacteria phage RB51]YP_002854443.1 starvation-inducible transcriptional regulator [Escherichia phage RB14]YP_004415002.1 starvation-inducible transcriptional regulator [Shigella phage Shfl2]YP_007004486.1 starvation-inducible transcriptional regulator [Escherichia phage ime09]YP_0090307
MKFSDFSQSGKPSKADEYLGLLMAAQAYFHSAHFETKSYARHKAYDFIFSELPDLIDKFGEQYLGYSGRKYTPSIPDASKLPTDTIKMIDRILDQSNSIYKEMPPAIQSTIDDITGMFYQSKYLLSLE